MASPISLQGLIPCCAKHYQNVICASIAVCLFLRFSGLVFNQFCRFNSVSDYLVLIFYFYPISHLLGMRFIAIWRISEFSEI